MKMNKPKILIKIINKRGKVKSARSKSTRRIKHFLKANNFLKGDIYLCVKYGAGLRNEGIYKTGQDTINALTVFMEEDRDEKLHDYS